MRSECVWAALEQRIYTPASDVSSVASANHREAERKSKREYEREWERMKSENGRESARTRLGNYSKKIKALIRCLSFYPTPWFQNKYFGMWEIKYTFNSTYTETAVDEFKLNISIKMQQFLSLNFSTVSEWMSLESRIQSVTLHVI